MLLRRRVVFFLSVHLVLRFLFIFGIVFIDGSSKHHEEGKQNVEVVGLSKALIDFCQKLAEDVGTSLIIDLFRFIVFGLLLLRIEIDVDLVEVTFHVYLFECSIVVPLLGICDKIAKPVDAIGGNIFSVTVTVVHFFLSFSMKYSFWTSSAVGIL